MREGGGGGDSGNMSEVGGRVKPSLALQLQQQLPQKGFPESGNGCFPANIKVCIIKSRTLHCLFARHE